MNFNRYDLVILVAMSFAVIVMSFTLPAAGLADASNETATSDIPEFDIDQSRFDFAGDFPENPGSATEGVIKFDETVTPNPEGVQGYSLRWIDTPKPDGASVEIQNATVQNWVTLKHINFFGSNGNPKSYAYQINGNEGQEILHQDNYTIEFTVSEVENFNQSDMYLEVDYKILDTPNTDDGGGLSAIPVIGGLFAAGEQLASTLAWIGLVIRWGVGFFFEVALNLVGILLDTVTFAFDLASFLTGSYTDVLNGASGWAAVVVLVPGVLLFAEFAKLAMIAVSLLPTT